jgi:hypothetical protein
MIALDLGPPIHRSVLIRLVLGGHGYVEFSGSFNTATSKWDSRLGSTNTR